jgi:hypothetical protein
MSKTNITLKKLILVAKVAASAVVFGSISARAQEQVTVYEFYNTNLNQYFRTADSVEASAIDSGGAGPGWSRTGDNFQAYASSFVPAGAQKVCRWYGSQNPGPNSHFYSADPSECDDLHRVWLRTVKPTVKRWNPEGAAFAVELPVNGQCTNGGRGIRRLYNDGFRKGIDSNHRYTTSLAEYERLSALGWQGEGVVMCESTSQISSTVLNGVVSGLSFAYSDGPRGKTDSQGRMPYSASTVVFSVGPIQLGSWNASPDYAFPTSISSYRGALKVLIALDANQDVSDGIQITPLSESVAAFVATAIPINLDDTDALVNRILSLMASDSGSGDGVRVDKTDQSKATAALGLADHAVDIFLQSAYASKLFESDYRLFQYLRGKGTGGGGHRSKQCHRQGSTVLRCGVPGKPRFTLPLLL